MYSEKYMKVSTNPFTSPGKVDGAATPYGWVSYQRTPTAMPGATAHTMRSRPRLRIEGAIAMADMVRPAAHRKPIGLAVDRPRLAKASIAMVLLGQASDSIADWRPQAASARMAAIARPQVISQPLGFTTTSRKTAIGVDTTSRKLPHNWLRRRM